MALEFVLTAPQAAASGLRYPVWTEPAFMNAIAGLHELKTYHVQCFKGDSLLAVLPVYERSLLGIRHLICPVLAYYQPLSLFSDPGTGPARQTADSLQIMTGLAAFLTRNFRKISFNLDPESTDVRAFTQAGFTAKPLYTYIHTGTELPRPTRNEQRKLKTASEQGYEYSEIFAPEEFISLLSSLYRKKGHRLGFSYPGLLGFADELHSAGILHQCNLHRGAAIVSSNLVFGSGSGTAYAVLGATQEDELPHGASSLQAVEMLRNLQTRYQRVDFCGGNVPEVARFKSGLGLELRLFFRIEGKSGLV